MTGGLLSQLAGRATPLQTAGAVVGGAVVGAAVVVVGAPLVVVGAAVVVVGAAVVVLVATAVHKCDAEPPHWSFMQTNKMEIGNSSGTEQPTSTLCVHHPRVQEATKYAPVVLGAAIVVVGATVVVMGAAAMQNPHNNQPSRQELIAAIK